LIDADLRRSSISKTLGLGQAQGLNDFLEATIDEAPIHLVEAGGFYVLAAGASVLSRPEVLCSPRMEALLRTARNRFDLVVLDTTPVLPVSDAIILQPLVDGFLLVARARKTPREAIVDCLARLRPDAVIGVVLNDCRDPRSSYRNDAYRKYGLTYDYAPTGPDSKES
jgi:Mrp family chromosome partitioning ATPase